MSEKAATVGGSALANHTTQRLLLCVTGASPQVITETLFVLATRNPAFLVDRVVVFTTALGRERLSPLLNAPTRLRELALQLGLPEKQWLLKRSDIEIFSDADGQPLVDLRTPDDNIAAADQIARRVAELTVDPHTILHASLAGGRKTMSFYLGYAMSLFGRPQDCLSHVLVNPPFEGHPAFWYPPDPPQTLELPNGSRCNTADAQVDLVDVPFLRLGQRLESTTRQLLMDEEFSFAESVRWAARANDSPQLHFRLSGPDHERFRGGGEVLCGESDPVRLQPSARELAMWLWFAMARLHNERRPTYVGRKTLDWNRYDRYMQAAGIPLDLPPNPDHDYFDQCLNALKRRVLSALGPYALEHYLPRSVGNRSGRYALDGIDPQRVRISAHPNYPLTTSL